MKILIKLFFIALPFFLVFQLQGQISTIHAIIITDSDPEIGAIKDNIMINDFIDRTGDLTRMNVSKKNFDKEDKNIVSAIQNIDAGDDDVIFVYYSGHGRNSGDGWPQFTANNNNYKLTSIQKVIEEKNARLNIVLFDCCNVGLTIENIIPEARLTPLALDILFKQAQGTIIASGASAGNSGFGTPIIGGFFTLNFIDAINNVNPSENNSLWTTVLQTAKKRTNTLCQTKEQIPQNPTYDIQIQGDNLEIHTIAPAPEIKNPHARDPFKK